MPGGKLSLVAAIEAPFYGAVQPDLAARPPRVVPGILAAWDGRADPAFHPQSERLPRWAGCTTAPYVSTPIANRPDDDARCISCGKDPRSRASRLASRLRPRSGRARPAP